MPNFQQSIRAEHDLQPAPRPSVETIGADSVLEDVQAARDLGLFIIWDKARPQQQRILRDLDQTFDLLRVCEIHWTPSLVMENFQRFYADIDLRGVYHALTKGAGPFVAILVHDPQPCFEPRETTRGWRTVNARLLDTKMKYRQWTGRFQVHSTETAWETNRDLSILLGVGAKRCLAQAEGGWNRQIEKLGRDLVGARGWRSPAELFWLLNRSVNYVAMEGASAESDRESTAARSQIQLLTDRYWAMHALTGTRQHPPSAPEGGWFPVDIGGAKTAIGIRFVGDGYYDPQMATNMLRSRILDKRGVYRPEDREYFLALAYDCLVHEPAPEQDSIERLVEMAAKVGLSGWSRAALGDPRQAKALLDGLLEDGGYSYIEPIDKAVFYNESFVQGRRAGMQRLAARLRWRITRARRKLTLPLLAVLWRRRDRLLLRFPVLRKISMWLRGIK